MADPKSSFAAAHPSPRARPSGRAVGALLGAMVAIGLGGLAASIALADGNPWTLDTLSHLGADPGAGSAFRLAMLLVGACGVVLAGLVTPLLRRLAERGLAGKRWARLHAFAFWAIGLGFLGVGAFPLGVSPFLEIAHGVAAYAPAIAALTLMLTATLAVPALGAGFGRASLVVLAGTLLLYLFAVAGLISYALMEALAFGLGGAWFVVFVTDLVRLDDLTLGGAGSDPGADRGEAGSG